MNKWGGLNKRKFPRVNYPCLVIVRYEDKDKDVILTHTENIGVGGVCVILKRNVEIFSPVEIELDLLDLGDHIRSKGKIVWNVRRKGEESKKPMYYDIGIEFDALVKKDADRLEEVISQLVRNQSRAAQN